jgi:hypothetical protein
MNTKTSSARKLAISAMTAGALAASIAVASPASAVVIKTGYGKINNLGLAVGTNIDPTTGVAAGPATFKWRLRNGVTDVNMTGNFSAVDRSGVPVRLDLYYYLARSGAGPVHLSRHTTGFTPASDAQELRVLNWTPPGDVGVQSAKLCVASDADRDGIYTDERCIISSL